MRKTRPRRAGLRERDVGHPRVNLRQRTGRERQGDCSQQRERQKRGAYIPAGTYENLSVLGLGPGGDGRVVRAVTLYVEGVRSSSAARMEEIRIELDPNDAGTDPDFLSADAVTATVVKLDVEMLGMAEHTETTPGAFIAVNDNDNAGAEGVPDRAEQNLPAGQADPDLQPLTLTLRPLPSRGTVTLRIPRKLAVWKDRRKTEKIFSPGSSRRWDLTVPAERSNLQTLLTSRMPLQVEASALGRAGTINLTYHAPSPPMSDEVTVSAVKVDVTQVPPYLFANACYATPIKFTVAGADNVPVRSVEVSFYADGKNPEQFTTNRVVDPVDLTARTMVLNGENANTPLVDARGRGNQFESYLCSTNLRNFELDGSHVTKNARFEVKVKLDSSAGPLSVVSHPRDAGSMVSERFHDRTVPAFDIREGVDATRLIETSMGAFYDVEGTERVTLASWHIFRPLKALWHAGDDVDAWRKRTVYFVSRPDGQYEGQEMGTWAKAFERCLGPVDDYEWSESLLSGCFLIG